ncbi:NAD(P)/FAD-dependent oxidoreductase [Streptomyces radicis]|uniref:Pyridine nucleotide-disulfide oxidoreductase n=1 Tax=Streptomyces radicis TaxID=1750517 RepID=A0A3A9WC80_9ACTN|nr:FAD-dependent oxidoreductase [Streptomyces radicis]RKN10961.1 pyridine nucleotide-disulfide oxidoreductase [Streptomyces radicis]RKN25224.1 pyridine nucleotide-disulfide oxidoreductase [Streptomyces radicis]
MSDTPQSVVVVGASQTAAVAARTLRRRGFEGRITLVGDEPHAPYQRPPLSKELLNGGLSGADTEVLSETWCADNAVELRLGTAARRVDTAAGAVELADGTLVPGDRFLLATGARARRLPGLEKDHERIIHLRGLDDALRLRALLRPGGRLVIVGAGFVGSEVASSALAAGVRPVVIEQAAEPLARVLGADLGRFCGRLQRDNGVELHTGETVSSVRATSDGVVVTTESGLRAEGDAVVVAVGALPNVDVARNSGISVSNGVLVDEYCRTSLPGVWAAGDVANHRHPLYGRWIRVEHFDNANKQGMAAAKNILGRPTVHDDPHWFWSDQFGLNLQHCGQARTWDRMVVRGSLDEADFIAFCLADGVLTAAFAAERGGDIHAARELIARRATPDPALLADEDVELAQLVDASAAVPAGGS